ncbi:MAG: hypoxanthine phosphoribosyltransferase [Parabacteroides sp.]|nr:hypoxanthine phosphoribosyltransferase [Parabacteroides sp.]
MNTVQVKDKQFALYISKERIQERVREVAAQMDADLREKCPLFLVVLNGSFVFAADLLRDVNFPCEITFIRMASYEGTSTTGQVKQVLGLKESIEERTVVIVEDIVDTGYTMQELLRILAEKNPKEVIVTALFVKPNNLKIDLDIHYRCFDIDNDFIVGYGLDYDHVGRNLPNIYKVIE